MKTIIAAIDFSAASLNAARYAADIARKMQARLYLFHVCIIPVAVSEVPVSAGDIDEAMEEAQNEISAFKTSLENRNGIPPGITTEVRAGDFLYELQEFCGSVQPVAVVIGTNGNSAVEKLFFGNNAVKTVAGIAWPLFVIPPGTVFSGIRKIGLACDYENVAATVPVAEIKSLVQLFDAELHVVHVSTSPPCMPPPGDYQSETLKNMLDDLNPLYHYMCRPDVDKGIAEFAEKSHLDLLITLPRRHSLVGSIFHKSHTKGLMLNARLPIMAIHK